MTEQDTPSADLGSKLAALLGSGHVLTDEADRRFFSQDIAGSKAVAGLVATPGTVEELAGAVAAAAGAGQAVVARGGGASYTSGFVPQHAESVILDTRRLDRIVDIDTRSMHVTVEAGCTWQRLTDSLARDGGVWVDHHSTQRQDGQHIGKSLPFILSSAFRCG